MKYQSPIGAIKKGALHRQLGMKQSSPISSSRLEGLKSSGTPLEKKRANFALNARQWNKKKKGAALINALRGGA